MKIDDINTDRIDYGKGKLDENDMSNDPIQQLSQWLLQARTNELRDYNAFTLGVIDQNGYPTTRIVLLRDCNESGLTFFTNYKSAKGEAIAHHNKVSVHFFWAEMERQIRILGNIEMVDVAESDAYFASRPRESQIGAWASQQSELLPTRQILEDAVVAYTQRFEGADVPRPPHWGGYRIIPIEFEFWQGRMSRLHDRFVYRKAQNGWSMSRLYP